MAGKMNILEQEKFINKLLNKMTLEEKVAQLTSVYARNLLDDENNISEEKMKDYLKYGIGEISRLAGGRDIPLNKVANLANTIQKFLIENTRLKIPAIIHEECLSGFMASHATTFPQAIGLASSWNPSLVKKVSSVIRRQMRRVGVHQGLAPVLDVMRDPRWGRTEETYGEDPYLVASIGLAYIEGLQGEDLTDGIIATPKHFVGYSFSEGGRNLAPVHVSERELREIFMFPFEVAIRQGHAMSLMNAYHEIDGIPCVASKKLFTYILRKEWGFEGFVVSDYGAIDMLHSFHKVAVDKTDAAIQALEAGIDLELPHMNCYFEPLLNAVKEGIVPVSLIDRSVKRVLKVKLLLGLFDNPFVEPSNVKDVIDTVDDRKIALEAARESIILLKNNGVLPLSNDISSIAVIGPKANSTRGLMGDYSFEVHINLNYDTKKIVSVLEGIKNHVSSKTRVYYAKGCDVINPSKDGFKEAISVAEKSDIVIAVMGESSGLREGAVTGENRDRANLDLPGVQRDLLDKLFELGKPIVLVLINGRPLAIGDIFERCAAVLEAWFPGEEGGNAIAEILFGKYNPSGRLPLSFPKHVGQLPVYYNRKTTSFREYVFIDSEPLYPFGYGLSYTKFTYNNLSIEPKMIYPGGYVNISLTVKNEGNYEGYEVVQLYIQKEYASLTRPHKELKGFAKVFLKPFEEKKIIFTLQAEQLAFYDRSMRLIVEPGVYTVLIGSSSKDIFLKDTFEIVGKPLNIVYRKNFFTKVKIL